MNKSHLKLNSSNSFRFYKIKIPSLKTITKKNISLIKYNPNLRSYFLSSKQNNLNTNHLFNNNNNIQNLKKCNSEIFFEKYKNYPKLEMKNIEYFKELNKNNSDFIKKYNLLKQFNKKKNNKYNNNSHIKDLIIKYNSEKNLNIESEKIENIFNNNLLLMNSKKITINENDINKLNEKKQIKFINKINNLIKNKIKFNNNKIIHSLPDFELENKNEIKEFSNKIKKKIQIQIQENKNIKKLIDNFNKDSLININSNHKNSNKNSFLTPLNEKEKFLKQIHKLKKKKFENKKINKTTFIKTNNFLDSQNKIENIYELSKNINENKDLIKNYFYEKNIKINKEKNKNIGLKTLLLIKSNIKKINNFNLQNNIKKMYKNNINKNYINDLDEIDKQIKNKNNQYINSYIQKKYF